MEKDIKKYESGVQVMIEVIGGKWKIPILYQLTTGKKRTSELRRSIPGISQKMLTQQLRDLEKDGIIHRIIHHEIPPKVEYEMSEYGLSLTDIIYSLCNWGEQHLNRMYGDQTTALEYLFNYDEPFST